MRRNSVLAFSYSNCILCYMFLVRLREHIRNVNLQGLGGGLGILELEGLRLGELDCRDVVHRSIEGLDALIMNLQSVLMWPKKIWLNSFVGTTEPGKVPEIKYFRKSSTNFNKGLKYNLINSLSYIKKSSSKF